MTVFILVSNGQQAVAISDRRKIEHVGGESYLHEDITKPRIIRGELHHGVIGWTGIASTAEKVFDYAGLGEESEGITNYGIAIANAENKYLEDIVRRQLVVEGASEEDVARAKASVWGDYLVRFGLIAYDKAERYNRIRMGVVDFNPKVNKHEYSPIERLRWATGDGTAKALTYLDWFPLGRPLYAATMGMLLRVGVGAYMASTLSPHVGSEPAIYLIDEENVSFMGHEDVCVEGYRDGCALSRLVGAFDQRMAGRKGERWLMQMVNEFLDGQPDYEQIADVLGTNVRSIQTEFMPLPQIKRSAHSRNGYF